MINPRRAAPGIKKTNRTMKKYILALSIALVSACGFSQTYSNIVGVEQKTGSTRSNMTSYKEGNTIKAAYFAEVTDGSDSTNSHLYLHGNLKVSGGQTAGYIEKAAAYTVAASDYVINCTSDTFNVQLPTAVGKKGQIYIIKSNDAGTVTATTTSSQTIDGATTKAITTKKTLIVMSTGANWIILSYN